MAATTFSDELSCIENFFYEREIGWFICFGALLRNRMLIGDTWNVECVVVVVERSRKEWRASAWRRRRDYWMKNHMGVKTSSRMWRLISCARRRLALFMRTRRKANRKGAWEPHESSHCRIFMVQGSYFFVAAISRPTTSADVQNAILQVSGQSPPELDIW